MTRDGWSPSRSIDDAYEKELQDLMETFVSFASSAGVTNPMEIVSLMMSFFGSGVFEGFAFAAASRMVTGLAVENARSWREAARQSMRGREIREALTRELQGPVGSRMADLVREHARYITAIPNTRIGAGRTLREQIADYIADQTMKGVRAETITKEILKQYPDVAASRVRMIARTQISSTSTALTRARSESLGLDWYVWKPVRDGRTRKSHRMMRGVLVNWSEPPAPEEFLGIKSTLGTYHAGQAPNCRCYPEPLLRLGQVDWPCKVFYNGVIKRMTRLEFARIAGDEVRDAA